MRPPDREAERRRKKIQQQVDEYIANGGEITHIVPGYGKLVFQPVKRTRKEQVAHEKRRRGKFFDKG